MSERSERIMGRSVGANAIVERQRGDRMSERSERIMGLSEPSRRQVNT
jgi:hypothetical protein